MGKMMSTICNPMSMPFMIQLPHKRFVLLLLKHKGAIERAIDIIGIAVMIFAALYFGGHFILWGMRGFRVYGL